MKRLFLLLPLVFLTACDVEVDREAEIEYLLMPGMEGLDLPFSSAVRVDNTLYVSGNLGNIPGTLELAEGGIQGETRQTLENIQRVVEQFGSSKDRCSETSSWPTKSIVRHRKHKVHFWRPCRRAARSASGGLRWTRASRSSVSPSLIS